MVDAAARVHAEPGRHTGNAEPGLDGRLGGMFEAIGSLAPEDVADLVAYTVSRPRHVNLRQIVVLPTRQA
ncbi:hypothetical protein [Streptosporangium saharense]|uniref:hypothetical protein n=1 Tax=Streptosporangium saharense TaxID=1706840 RepID=UPI00332412A8